MGWWFSKQRRKRRWFFRDLGQICNGADWDGLEGLQGEALDADDRLIVQALSAYMSWQGDDHRVAQAKFSALYSRSKAMEGTLPAFIKRFALYYIALSRGDYASARSHQQSARSTKVYARVKVLLPMAAIYNVPHTPPSISASA